MTSVSSNTQANDDNPKPFRLSIIGGGPGGLALARILQQTMSPKDLQVRVYERDTDRHGRALGGSLDLRDNTGLRAIRDAGLLEEFGKRAARPEGDHMRVFDKFGVMRVEVDAPGRPEIDRVDLRGLLIDSLNSSTIQWNHQLVSLQPVPSSTTKEYELTFSSGKKVITDLVVGADGAWSRIRPLLIPDSVPVYTGLSCFDLDIHDVEERYPHLVDMSKNSLSFILGDRKSILTQPNRGGKIKINCGVWVDDEGWIDQFRGMEPKKLKEKIVELFEGFDEKLRDFIRAGDENDILIRKVYAIPLENYNITTAVHPSITFLENAAHVMSPFAGEGVNLALADAADLASHLSAFLSSRSGGDTKTLQDVLKAYAVVGTFERAKGSGMFSARNLKDSHEEDAVERTVARFEARFGPKKNV